MHASVIYVRLNLRLVNVKNRYCVFCCVDCIDFITCTCINDRNVYFCFGRMQEKISQFPTIFWQFLQGAGSSKIGWRYRMVAIFSSELKPLVDETDKIDQIKLHVLEINFLFINW